MKVLLLLAFCYSILAVANICDLDLVTGPCRARILKYGFNKTAGECQEFVYGGCRGNANRFDNSSQCEQQCSSIS